MPPDPQDIARLAQTVSDTIALRSPSIVTDFPIERYLAHFDALPALAPYHAVPSPARAMALAIARHGEELLEAYKRLAMLSLIARGAPGSGARLSDEIADLLDRKIERIVAEIAEPRPGFYSFENDRFAKDFAICRGTLVPGGVELIELAAGIGKSAVLGGAATAAIARLAFFGLRMGGFKTFFALHFDRRSIAGFNETGYDALYRRAAGLLACNPDIGGIVSISWWHDPALASISPELGFIDRIPRENGARIMRLGEDARATSDAIRLAPARAALHRDGHYRPSVYLLAWPRRDALAWSLRSNPS